MIPKTFLKLCPLSYTRWNFLLAGLHSRPTWFGVAGLRTRERAVCFDNSPTVQAAKTKFDPKNVLTPGHAMFPG